MPAPKFAVLKGFGSQRDTLGNTVYLVHFRVYSHVGAESRSLSIKTTPNYAQMIACSLSGQALTHGESWPGGLLQSWLQVTSSTQEPRDLVFELCEANGNYCYKLSRLPTSPLPRMFSPDVSSSRTPENEVPDMDYSRGF